jgi:homoserine dehydrogenase
MTVTDAPGVLAQVATCFARHEVSLQAVRQESQGVEARLGVMTHLAMEDAISATLADLRSMAEVRPQIAVMRVEGA